MGLIRFFLAYSVVVAHFLFFPSFRLIGGEVAVEAFFIISGFYIAMILNGRYSSIKDFWINRFLRLYPAYIVIAGFNLVVNLIEPGELKNVFELPTALSIYLVFTNATMMFQDLAMFLGVRDGHVLFVKNFLESSPVVFRYLLIPQAWTLGVEISFYLLAPLLFFRKYKYIYLFFFISLIVRIYLLTHGKMDDPWSYRFFPSELALFMLGAIAYNVYDKIDFNKNPALLQEIGKWFLVLVMGFIFFFPNIAANYEFKKGLFYLLLAVGMPLIFNLTKDNKIDRFIGELSYPIYLIWGLRIDITKIICDAFQITNENVKGLIFYGSILLLAIAIHVLVEKPVEKIRAHFRARKSTST